MKERKKPETLRLRTVNPTLTVDDLEASIAFYRDFLGFVVAESWEDEGHQGAELQAGSVHLVLSQDDFAKGRDRKKGIGFRLWCVTTQDLDELAANIEERGGTLSHPVSERSWGGRDFGVVDPDGFAWSFTNLTE